MIYRIKKRSPSLVVLIVMALYGRGMFCILFYDARDIYFVKFARGEEHMARNGENLADLHILTLKCFTFLSRRLLTAAS